MFCNNCGNQLNESGICPVCTNTALVPNKRQLGDSQKGIIAGLATIVGILFIVLIAQSFFSNDVITESNTTRTVMIYMVGSNLESDAKIATSDIDSIDPTKVDLENVNVLLYTGGTEKWHNFVSNEENAIYHLKSSGFEKVESYEKFNMGDSKTLTDFLNYGYQNFKANKYDLIFYNHGGAIDGAIYDDFTKDNLSLVEFRDALENSPFNKTEKLETVLFRTCLNGTLEVANVFSDYADYMVASEEITNGATGLSVLDFLNNITVTDRAIDYGVKYIDSYDRQMQQIFTPLNLPMVYSVIDLSRVDELNKELRKFIKGIDLKKNYPEIVKLRANLFQFGYSFYNEGSYDMVDLYSLVEGLAPYSKDAPDKVLSLIDSMVSYNWTSNDDFHGISVYFPYRASRNVKTALLNSYENFSEEETYLNFIKEFNDLSTSNKTSSFSTFSNKSDVSVNEAREFSLTLTSEQAADYADSIYILFSKQKNGKFKSIYSSDNAVLDNGVLRTNISNNLIKVRDTSDNSEAFVTLIERMKNNQKSLLTNVVLTDSKGGNFRMNAATSFFEFKEDGNPELVSYIEIGGDNGAAGNVLNIDDYTSIGFISSDYQILDASGHYTDKWDNGGVISGVELKIENMEFKRATLDDAEDYYCVFKVYDIYGNYYYSDLIRLT